MFDNCIILFDAILPCWYNEELSVFVLCILEYPLNSGFLEYPDGMVCVVSMIFLCISSVFDLDIVYILQLWQIHGEISLFSGYQGYHRNLGSPEFPLIAQYLSGGVICLNAAVLGFAAWHWQLLILLRFWLSSQMLPWMFSYNKSRLSESSDQVLYLCIYVYNMYIICI